jgi:hypothetical protein
MTRQVRRAVLALIVFAASGAAHREAHADLGEKLCTMHCSLGTIQCHQDGGSTSFCGGFATGCMIGCKVSVE